MPLSRNEIEQPRSPEDLQSFINRVQDEVRSDPSEREAGNAKRGLYKRFLDEIVPLARFAALAYDDSYTIQPILGNQGYDAIVFGPDGVIVDKVEIANPILGELVAETARELARDGVGGFRAGAPGDELDALIPTIEKTARAKANKDYSDVTVVFNLSVLPPLRGFESSYEGPVEKVSRILSSLGFRAKRVFLLHPYERIDRIEL